jgi:hypothetical protein
MERFKKAQRERQIEKEKDGKKIDRLKEVQREK